MSVTLQQIADLAGTTKSTVDKVIHDRPGVSKEKRQEIKNLLKEYGYEANPLAKALNYQKRKLKVAIILPALTATPLIKSGMEAVRQDFLSFNIQVEYHEIAASDAVDQVRCIRKIADEKVSGAVILPIRSEIVKEAVKDLVRLDIPVVIVNSELDVDGILYYVGQDMLRSGGLAARMLSLFSGGSANIGIISCRNMIGHEQREQSFIKSVQDEHPGFHIVSTRHIVETPEDAYDQTVEMLTDNPEIDSVFITCGCVEDICRGIKDSKMAARHDAQPVVICYEKYDEIRALISNGEVACSLTGSLFRQGHLSMRILFEYLVYDRLPEEKAHYFGNKIMIRENI